MPEIEVKLRVDEETARRVRGELRLDRKTASPETHDAIYFDTKGGPTLRLREETDRYDYTHLKLTVKGPSVEKAGITSRLELERSVFQGDGGFEKAVARKEWMEILALLGFNMTFNVKKFRHEYFVEELSVCVCVDEVEDLGHFIEIESFGLAPEDAAPAIEEMIKRLDLGLAAREKDSYEKMMREALDKSI